MLDMISIWFKIYKNHKIINQKTLKIIEPYSQSLLASMIEKVVFQLSLPMPVLLSSHFLNYEMFNSMKLYARDFIEKVNFDFIEIVNIGH